MTVLLEAFFIGVLAGLVVIYAFQTRVVYPRWMLHTLDQPWALLLGMVLALLLFPYSPRASALAILLVLALWMDLLLFARALPARAPRSAFEGRLEYGLVEPGAQDVNGGTPLEVWPYDEPWAQRDYESAGPPIASVPLAHPQYPTFFGLDLPQPGPAPF